MSGRAPRCFTSVIGLVLAAVVGCQGPPPSIGHFNLIGFDEGGHHAASPATVAPCSTEERDLAFEDTVAYLHTDDDERVRPTAACCTPHANRWDFLLSPYPEHGPAPSRQVGARRLHPRRAQVRRVRGVSPTSRLRGDRSEMNIARRVILFLGALATGAGIWLGAVTPTIFTLAAIIITPAPILFTWRPFHRRSWVQRVSGTTRSLRRSSRSAASDGSPSDPSARSASIVGATPRWSVPERTSRATGLACASSTRGSALRRGWVRREGRVCMHAEGCPEWLHGYDCEVNIPPHPMRWSP